MPETRAWLGLRPALAFSRILLTLSLVLLYGVPGASEDLATNSVNSTYKDFYWIDIEPSHELVWHPCYRPLRKECARLLVPLNHLNHSDESPDHAAIALIRIPSPFSSSRSCPHPRYRGPILFNPGGPGDSGVDFILRIGDLLAQVLGSEFDIVSFDPRGVARSTPKVSFYEGVGRGEREVWGASGPDVLRGGGTDKFPDVEGEKGRSLEQIWAQAVVNNQRAGERAGQWLGNVNTEQTAHDMLSIVRAHGREKLMYWGFSYGTVLGATFASLFPDKVERIILDGVVDVDNYYATLWTNNLLDTPKTMNLFFKNCHAAGPACPFWAPSPSLIAANLTRIYKDLITNPIPLQTSTSYGFLDYPRMRQIIFLTLYNPWASWPILAEALSDLGGPNRDPRLMWRLTGIPTFKCSCSSCDSKDRHEKEFEAVLPEVLLAILCSDGVDIPADVTSAKRYFENLSNKYDWADIWANIRVSCAGWPKAKKGYQGPVGADNTSFPLLFIGNTADPVTPVTHARAMSKRFPGSRVLTQDSPGHCSINAPSVCTLSHIRNYFISGKLPPENVVCPTDIPPFPDLGMDSLKEPSFGSVLEDQEGMKVLSSVDPDTAVEASMMKAVADELARAWKPFNSAFMWNLKDTSEVM